MKNKHQNEPEQSTLATCEPMPNQTTKKELSEKTRNNIIALAKLKNAGAN